MKNPWVITLIIVIGLLILIQLIPVDRTNPPVSGEIQVPTEISKILQKSCYDCHSYQTHWPWYSKVAPSSWLVVHDVNEGREHLNFSTWNSNNSREKIKMLEEIREVLEEEEMPLKQYLWLHPDAKLSEKQTQQLFQWIADTADHRP